MGKGSERSKITHTGKPAVAGIACQSVPIASTITPGQRDVSRMLAGFFTRRLLTPSRTLIDISWLKVVFERVAGQVWPSSGGYVWIAERDVLEALQRQGYALVCHRDGRVSVRAAPSKALRKATTHVGPGRSGSYTDPVGAGAQTRDP